MRYLVQPLFAGHANMPGIMPGKIYTIAAVNSGRVASVRNGAVIVEQRNWSENPRQQWRLEALTGPNAGYFRLVSVESGRVLTVPNPATLGDFPVTAQITQDGDNVNEDGREFYAAPPTREIWFGTGKSTTKNFAGLRFSNLAVPQGAVITSARLELYVNREQWIRVGVNIGADAADDSPAFSATDRPSKRALTSARFEHGDDVQWDANTWYGLGDLSPLIQEITSRPGWKAGNSLSLILKGTYGKWARKFVNGYGSNPAHAPRLVVTYRLPFADNAAIDWHWLGGFNQQWQLDHLGTGVFRITSRENGWVLDVEGGSVEQGARIIQHPWHDAINQKWLLSSISDYVTSYGYNNQATFYEHVNYEGASQSLGIGSYNINNLTMGNDILSSIKIPTGLQVTLWEHADFKGRTKTFTADTPYIGDDFNDITSGISIEPVATIYEHANYEGAAQTLGVGTYNIGDLTFGNDLISSVRVPHGMMVTLYEHANLQGRSRTFTESEPWVGDDFNDITSSIVVKVMGIRIPNDALKYGDKISIRASNGRFLGGDGGSVTATRDTVGPSEEFTVVRAGNSKFENYVSYGDVVALRSAQGQYLSVGTNGTGARFVDGLGPSTQFIIFRSGSSLHKGFVSIGDTISLKSLASSTFVGAAPNGHTNAASSVIAGQEQWAVRAPEDPQGSSAGATACGAEACGVDVCGAEGCGADVCGVAVCAADGTIIGVCAAAATGVAVCAADLGGASACGAAAGGATVCGADACGAAACAAAACGAAACAAAACGAAACAADACGVDICPADVCGAEACGLEACAAEACAAEACAAEACAADVCPAAVCAAEACAADVCGAEACAADVCGAEACGAEACAAEACAADACPVEACAAEACAAEACAIDACPANACAANACAIDACPADACAADACALDIIPIIPGI